MGTPALAPPDVRDVTLALFAGRKTDVAPSDLPEGLTPDEQDGIYLPGQWQSRPGLSRVYQAGLLQSGNPAVSCLYEKTYVQPNGIALTMLLMSDGSLWVEQVGVAGPIPSLGPGFITPGLYGQSVTEFGREYQAFSDLLHGQDVPLQFDGTNLDRVTQDGPGAAPTFTADVFTAFNISLVILLAPPGGLGAPGINSATVSGNLATLVLGSAHGLVPGNFCFATGVGVAGYNGFHQIVSVPSPTSLTFNVSGALANSAGGFLWSNQLRIVLTAAGVPAGVNIGDNVTIAGYVPDANTYNPNNGFSGNPATWQVISVDAGVITIAITQSTQTPTIGTSGTGGTITVGGQSSGGVHQAVVMFLTRQGYITKPSPALFFTSAGNSKWSFANLPIGPSNVVARILGFTGVGGDNFFIVPASVTLPNPSNPLGTPIVVQSTIIQDNTSTTCTIDVPDDTLFAALAIDQIGNDLFDQVVLGPVLGFFAYASRLITWGDFNKVENFLNMGFEGGAAAGSPLGWSVVTGGGSVIPGGAWVNGECWQINGNLGPGPPPPALLPQGEITQPADQDSFGATILEPNTFYMARAWLSGTDIGGQNVVVELFSASTGYSAIASLTVPRVPGFVLLPFSARTPAVIANDLLLRVYTLGQVVGSSVLIDELQIIFAENPYHTIARASYVNNPEAFAQTTGGLGPTDDSSPVRCFSLLRVSALLMTAEGVHSFIDNDGEPSTWNVNPITRSLGALSLKSGDPGMSGTGDGAEDWTFVASKNGVYLFSGAEFWKVSQELSRDPGTTKEQDPRKCWDDINWEFEHTIVTKNDPANRRAYFAVPLDDATTPNVIFALDYREMDTATQIAGAAPLHITLQGKMRSSDLTRKWSVWTIPVNDIEILDRADNERELCLAGGEDANGDNFGNLYALDPANLTDDDYGRIGGTVGPYYTTYFFTDHETEQALGLGSDMKLVKHIHAFVAGVGQVTLTPIVNSLYNFMPSLTPRLLVEDTDQSNCLKSDLEWTSVGVRGQRIAFRVSVQPLPGQTDVQIRLQKFIVSMMKDPVVQFRQSGV